MLYNSILYKNRPIKYQDYISNKYNIIHRKLYDDALNKYIRSYINDIISGKFMHRIFQMFNIYFSEHTDKTEEDIIDYTETFDKITGLSIIPMSDILNNEQYSKESMQELIDTIYEDELIKKTIDNLQIYTNNKKKYIKYVIVNILYFVYCLKRSLANISNFADIINIADISDFIITYKESCYMIAEDNDDNLTLIQTEYTTKDIMFIYEYINKGDIHIGYTEDGKWLIDISSEIDLSDEELQQILKNLINTTNYNLWNMFIDNIKEMFLKTHKIIENKLPEYWQPSKIMIITTFYPYKKQVVDLAPWWNDYQEYKNHQIENLIADETMNMVDAKVEYIDYVRGKTTIYSKSTDVEKTVDLNYIHGDTEMDDEATLANTFTYKLKHIRGEYE